MWENARQRSPAGPSGSEASDALEIRSFRRVFELERRLYRIDRIRLNPAGVPLRGVVYFVVLLMLASLASHAVLVGQLVRLAPWYVRDVAGPGLTACLLTTVRVDGRSAHVAAASLLRRLLRR